MDYLDKKIKESQNAIPESNINNPNEIYEKAFQRKEKVNVLKSNLFMKYAICFLLIIAITISSIAIFNKSNGPQQIIIGNKEQGNLDIPEVYNDEIKKAASIDEIKNLVINATNSNVSVPKDEDLDFDIAEGGNSGDALVTNPNYSSSSTPTIPDINTDHIYETNVQVKNVDEGDIVKVNGDYIYYVTKAYTNYKYNSTTKDYDISQMGRNCLYILKANGDTLDVIKEITFDDNERLISQNEEAKVIEEITNKPKELLFTDKYIVLSVSTNKTTYVEYNNKRYSSKYQNYTEFYLYDINTFEYITNINVPGRIVTTRMIDNQLYVISNYNDYKQNNYVDLLPIYYIGADRIIADINNIYYCPGFGVNVNAYVVIFRITLDTDIKIEDFYFLSPSINNVYVNTEGIYLIRSYSNMTTKESDRVINWPSSKVLIIDIKDDLKFDGMVEVKGQINDKYWIDEYQGFLRIATTGTKYSYKVIADKYQYDRQSEVFNFLTVFSKNKEGKWKEVSAITEGLGEVGESLKSARFNGNTATLVTFRQTDPLYYVDLTDHLNPKITSELKISGYSVYQHPYKDNYVIGIGYEATDTGSTTGYKVALFDISDKENIKQVGDALIFDYDEYMSLEFLNTNNPKELFLDLDNDIFGFAIRKSIKETFVYPDGVSYNRYYSNCFKLIKIDLNSLNPLSIIEDIEKVNVSTFKSYKTIDRMVFIKDKYYLLATDEVRIYQLTSDDVKYIGNIELN